MRTPFIVSVIPTLFFLSVSIAWSQCSEIDLRKPGYSMESVLPRNQGAMGTCFVHAASKAFEATLKSEGSAPLDFNISVAHAVLSEPPYTEMNQYPSKPEPYEILHAYFGGKFCRAFEKLAKNGACFERDIEGAMYDAYEDNLGRVTRIGLDLFYLFLEHNPHFGLDLRAAAIKKNLEDHFLVKTSVEINKLIDELVAIEEQGDEYQNKEKRLQELQSKQDSIQETLHQTEEPRTRLKILRKLADEKKEAAEYVSFKNKKKSPTIQACFLDRGSPERDVNRLINLVKDALGETNPFEAARNSVLALCQNRVALKRKEAIKCETLYRRQKSNNELVAFVDESLNQGKKSLPVGIGFDPTILRSGKITYETVGDKASPKRGGHSSLIVGRKSIQGKCSYLIRNSWQANCDNIHSEFECEAGDVWLPGDLLFESVTDLERLNRL